MDLFIGISNLFFGIVITLVGFRVYSPFKGKDDPEKEERWYKKFGTFFKIAGILILVVGVIKTLSYL